MLLAGDIGGTKTVLALFSAEIGPHTPLVERTYPSGRYDCLETIVRTFLDEVRQPVERACFGVAGPVVAGQAQVTNLPWAISEERLCAAFGWERARLLNDLEAVAYAVPILEPDDLLTLNAGEAAAQGNIAVIAPGTGLGEAFLTWEGTRYRAHASEGGHASFAPANEQEISLLRYMREQLGHGHVSFERVCSGIGIPNLYAFLKASGFAEEPAWLAARLADATDPTPVIVAAAHQSEPCALAQETLRLFVHILGGEAGNLALKILATGGVYIGGGIPLHILPALRQPAFLEAFCHKGRFRPLLTRMPVHVILNAKAALLGAAACELAH
jgi:glucokinase